MYELVEYIIPIEFENKELYDYWQEEYMVDHFILSRYTESGYDLERTMEIAWYSTRSIRNYNFNLIFNI